MKVVHVARKPCSEGTVAANVLRHGVGALNVDATRISTAENLGGGAYSGTPRPGSAMGCEGLVGGKGSFLESGATRLAPSEYKQPSGRWPANFLLRHLNGCRKVGERRDTFGGGLRGTSGFAAGYAHDGFVGQTVAVAVWACVEGCPVEGLNAQSGITSSHDCRVNTEPSVSDNPSRVTRNIKSGPHFSDTGGASRFFWQGVSVSELTEYLRALTTPGEAQGIEGVFVEAGEGYDWSAHADASVHAILMSSDDATDIGEAYRVLKPGGHLLLAAPDGVGFVGACVAEDVGFEVRDCICVADAPEDRLHYVPKASARERDHGLDKEGKKRANQHPTVKPIKVMERLLSDVPHGLVLDPFLGSGTTGIAALRTGHRFVGVEREVQWHATAVQRIAAAIRDMPGDDGGDEEEGGDE